MGEISRRLYPTKKISTRSTFEAAIELVAELQEWKRSVHPLFSSVRASSLIPPLCRQSHVLQLAYCHAMIHATRPFILNDFTDLTRRPLVPLDLVATHVHNCIDAARDVMQRVDALAGQGVMMESFWFTHYVCFCAIIVAYIYTIQHQSSNDPNSPAVSSPADEVQDLFTLAENCQFHLARATQKNCPSRRYSFILEELRLEVHRQLGSPTQPHPDVLRLSDGEARERLAEDSVKPREGETEASQSSTNLTDNVIFEPYLGNAAAPNLVGTSDAIGNDFTFLDSLDGSVWWTQLDSWVSTQTQILMIGLTESMQAYSNMNNEQSGVNF
jgi:hypothetical protein